MFQAPLQNLALRHWGVYLTYGLTVAGIGGVAVSGARALTNAYVAIAAQTVADNPRPLSRVERHMAVTARSIAFKPVSNDDDVVALVSPDMHPARLAAAIDKAEQSDIAEAALEKSRTVVLAWSKEEGQKARGKTRTSKSKLAAASRSGRKPGKGPGTDAGASGIAVAANQVGTAPLPGKMSLLPKPSNSKTAQLTQSAVTLALQSEPTLPSRRRGTTPGEIIRISLLGAD